jgi:hypothetical protein
VKGGHQDAEDGADAQQVGDGGLHGDQQGGKAMSSPDHQPDEDDHAEPDRSNDDRAVGPQTTEPVQDTGQADNLSPDPDQRTH